MRLELAKRSDLALRGLQALSADGNRLSGTDLAEILGTTHQYLPQIISPLVRKRWVESTRGPGGGYRLIVSLSDVTVLELIETMEGTTDTATCVLSGETCDPAYPCALHDAWAKARDALLAELDATSIADA